MNMQPVPAAATIAVSGALSLLPAAMSSPQALAMLYAIGMQESRFLYRRQMGDGPARGFWQMERGGGVLGVVTHPSSRYWMASLCAARGVSFAVQSVYDALETDDVLAAGAARLLLFTDPRPLPDLGDLAGSWNLYARVWRPGQPKRATWLDCYAAARYVMTEVIDASS